MLNNTFLSSNNIDKSPMKERKGKNPNSPYQSYEMFKTFFEYRIKYLKIKLNV